MYSGILYVGLCPDWEDWDPKKAKENAKEAMDAAEKWLDVPQVGFGHVTSRNGTKDVACQVTVSVSMGISKASTLLQVRG